jgi:hypothetical protein
MQSPRTNLVDTERSREIETLNNLALGLKVEHHLQGPYPIFERTVETVKEEIPIISPAP